MTILEELNLSSIFPAKTLKEKHLNGKVLETSVIIKGRVVIKDDNCILHV